jgi:hypothetical protein
MARSLSALPALLAGFALSAALPLTPLSAADRIDTREPGVVCDSAEQLCYDGRGLALEATRRSFGRYGEDKARRLIAKGERGRTFLLSNGVACDVGVRTCWEDGWKRRNVAKSMTRHLFSGGGTGTWNDDWSGNGTATMRNGPRYVFRKERGSVWISDSSGGSWPVQHRDYGKAAVFRWADMSLEARQGSYRGSGSDRNRDLEGMLQQLFN